MLEVCIAYSRLFLKRADREALKNINPSYTANAKLIGDKYYCFNSMAEGRQACVADAAQVCHTAFLKSVAHCSKHSLFTGP